MNRKTILALLAITLTALLSLSACGEDKETTKEKSDPTELSGPVKVVAQNNATGVSVFKEMGDNYELTTYKKIGDVREAIKEGKYDAAILSAGIAAEMYDRTKGGLVEVSPVSLGGIHIVASGYNKDRFGLSALQKRQVVIMGKNSTADQVVQEMMAKEGLGFSSVKTKYINSYSGVKKAFKNWGAIVICTEPYASKLEKLSDVHKIYDLGAEYSEVFGSEVPTEVLVVSKKMLKDRPDDIKVLIKAYQGALPKISGEDKKTYSKFVFYGDSNRGEMLMREYNENMDNDMKYYSIDAEN